MSDLKNRLRELYLSTDDWGHATNRRAELEIGLSLTPAERLRWLEERQAEFLSAAAERDQTPQLK